ncbi:MAG: M48 family metallopeptidase, partial [Candidatus Rokubacteria bacterium]|nr:M48 family metallopeptidase [Candidatus Rokubacteria bacterium]
VDDPTVNALAAPGGFIVVFRGLLERTRTPEELAGVLAHEIEHVLQRHATKALVQHVSTGLLFTALTGDVSGVMAYGFESARVLGTLRYSRAAEEEADTEGMRLLLAAHIDPAGMIAFFEGMEKRRGEAPGLLTYLSTHPAPEERVARLTRLARAPVPAPSRKLLDGYDWADIRRICG